MEPASNLPVQEIRPRGLRLAPCLWELAATVLLMQEADKLILGQHIILWVPHQVTSLLNSTASQWMTGEPDVRLYWVRTPGCELKQ
jgi:hypothetical protein